MGSSFICNACHISDTQTTINLCGHVINANWTISVQQSIPNLNYFHLLRVLLTMDLKLSTLVLMKLSKLINIVYLHHSPIMTLMLESSPTGWLENTVIQQAHVLLKKINPDIQGFQLTSLGPFSNFDQVCGDFVQILHTGGNHWVCASSIGCEKGVVNLYDSLFYDVILHDLQQQVENLVGEDFREINVVPIQQQSNGSDCGVFAIAFATNLVYTLDSNIPQFNILQM